MRLHHLTITAFGPFAGTETVDLDELGAAGLFLLTGPTGAGKSSVLDAVCFALYGEVPGDRGGARQLRSDHAGPHDEPRVTLRFSVGDRRLRISRSPAWDRPKQRDTGTRRIQASVVAEEERGGRWEAVSTRLDETGQLVGELLGMTCTQFTQVALLPQGRFQTFLRASSTERHDVLKRLFRTRRYDDVEHWLAERRREAQRAANERLARCAALLDRLAEATGAELPVVAGAAAGAADGSTAVLQALDADGLAAWLAGRVEQAERELLTAREHELAEAATVASLRTRLETEQAVVSLRRRGERARHRLAVLDDAVVEVEKARRRVARDAAARPVLPHARRRQQASTSLEQSVRSLERERLAAPGAPHDSGALEHAVAELTRRSGEAQGWLPREAELRALAQRRDRLEQETAELARACETLAGEVARVELEVARLETERGSLADPVATVTARLAEAERAAAGEAAAREAQVVRAELREVVSEQQALTTAALELRAAHLDVKQARIEGAAAELAAQLAAGCSCPVCGSVEHPRPARRRDTVGQAEEDAALAAFESAESARMAADEGVAGVRARLASWEARAAGTDLAGWAVARERADAALAEARRCAAGVEAVDARLERLRPGLERSRAELETARRGRQQREAALEELRAQHDRLAADLADLLLGEVEHDDPHRSVTDLVAGLDERREQLTALLHLCRAVDEATAAADQATAAADAAVADAGFDDLASCLAAVLDDAELDRLGRCVDEWEHEHAEVTRVLAEADVQAALTVDEPDVAGTRTALAAHVAAHEEAAGRRRAAEHRQGRATALVGDLRAALADWRPLCERHRTLASLSGLVEGTSPDNRLRMRLTGYVLAERLRQVVAAANVRLAAMTDDRFALEHAEEKGAGEQRGGLSLRVRDDWSGTRRDPATLSGGESFVVSLALALGLADTVAHEAGGTAVETLFVDEGFGSLDSDTLDAVMDVLDGLRDGGRVVGLVSHVAELRARVPAQLEVRKARHGSTVTGAVHAG